MEFEGCTMELLLKVPKDKPPVIAVVFNRFKEACEMNEDLVNEHSNLPYYIKFANNSSKGINIEIFSEKLSGRRFYKDVKYDRMQLENFLYITSHKPNLLFTHLLYDFEQHFPVKTYSKSKRFELKIERAYSNG